MSASTGPEHLNDNARRAFAELRSDPRLSRARGSMLADFRSAMDEAERMRELGVWGLYELTRSLEREEQRLGARRDDLSLSAKHQAALQAAWERAEIARIEQSNEHPHLHASALIAMVSALDAMVEELVPAFRQMLVDVGFREAAKRAKGIGPAADDALAEAQVGEAMVATRDDLVSRLPKLRRLHGKGTARYEDVLQQVRLHAPLDRPIPDDLAAALVEVGALRDVLVHRAGRVDARALTQAPSLALRYADGTLVRLCRADYRRYSAAIRCYGAEISRRAMLGVYDGTDHDVDLAEWQGRYRRNA